MKRCRHWNGQQSRKTKVKNYENRKNKNTDELVYISKDAMCVSVLNVLFGYFHGDNKTMWQKLTKLRLEGLMSTITDIDNVQEFQALIFILIIDQVVGIAH